MFSTIVLGVDGSAPSEKTAEYAINLAQQCGSKVLLIHVVDFSAFKNIVATPRDIAKHVYEKVMEEAQGYLDDKEALCKEHGLECEKFLKIGNPEDEIIKLAKNSNAGVIVLGSKGRSGVAGSILGSVAYGVLHRDKDIPVLVIKS
ncbi:MAG: universal stress protein [Deltaproteobacteria bacterium]|nr:universal stress protein [Deltaproteobacteria bacterium]